MEVQIREIDEMIKKNIVDFIASNWGSAVMVSRGRVHLVDQLDGFAALDDTGQIKGLVTYRIDSDECEIVTLDSLVENRGIGSNLVKRVLEAAREKGCRRVWLITTNDNTRALRFYQKRGFNMKALHINAVQEARRIKPEIPSIGVDGIPILHEIELEKVL